ncbi:hypothetical protein OE88DRAFT_1662660 [Heliocybe sulcata]|uniref:Uncharacterized protein n=1 Tax=Heliocybe sulcata TaxID=5364 RepID=A0A5C3N670_9AGAM|nr:hypothetical protein OE88DRAFT_1662660 [Heliocybe sulcata]
MFATPRTPRSYTLPAPSDSPTNPFGLSRPRKADPLKLPSPISYSRYLALRIQIVGHPCRDDLYQGGKTPPYRIVHVPVNYSLKLFQKLIMFLFQCEQADVAKMQERNAGGHLFEIAEHVAMCDGSMRAGQIKTSRVIAKLSSERDPYFRPGGLEEDTGVEDDGSGVPWSWENEDEFTLRNVWPRGADPRRALIYHHNNYTILHVTINTIPVQARKGLGNRPFTFLARGHIDLNELPALFSPSRIPVPKRKSAIFPSGKDALPVPPWMARPKDPEASISVLRWNAVASFEAFLDRCRAVGEEASALDEAEPQGWNAMPSSEISFADAPTPGLSLLSSSSPNAYGSTPATPDPVRPLHKLIVDRTSRRLSALTQHGLCSLESDDDDDDEVAEDALKSSLFTSKKHLQYTRGHGKVRGIDVDEDGREWETDLAKERKLVQRVLNDNEVPI